MLDEVVQKYLGQHLHVHPIYGWGWDKVLRTASSDSGFKSTEAKVPNDFHMRLKSLFSFRGEWIGGVGRIEHRGHKLDGWWVIFQPGLMERCDFVERVPNCNLIIGPDEPKPAQDGMPGFASEPQFITGFGRIRKVENQIS